MPGGARDVVHADRLGEMLGDEMQRARDAVVAHREDVAALARDDLRGRDPHRLRRHFAAAHHAVEQRRALVALLLEIRVHAGDRAVRRRRRRADNPRCRRWRPRPARRCPPPRRAPALPPRACRWRRKSRRASARALELREQPFAAAAATRCGPVLCSLALCQRSHSQARPGFLQRLARSLRRALLRPVVEIAVKEKILASRARGNARPRAVPSARDPAPRGRRAGAAGACEKSTVGLFTETTKSARSSPAASHASTPSPCQPHGITFSWMMLCAARCQRCCVA